MANQILKETTDLCDPSIAIPSELTPGGDAKINAASWLSVGLQIAGYMDQAMAENYKDSRILYHINGWAAWRGLEAGQWKFSETVLENYLPMAREFGDPFFILFAESNYYAAKAFQGDRTALDILEDITESILDMGFKSFFSIHSSYAMELFHQFEEYEQSQSISSGGSFFRRG